MPALVCPCGASIPPKRPGVKGQQARWCSRPCWQRDADAKRKAKRDESLAGRLCPMCNVPVAVGLPAHAIYCSQDCKTAARRKSKREVECPCGTRFTTARTNARYCSTPCLRRGVRDNHNRVCATDGCELPTRAKGLCKKCYRKANPEKWEWTDRRRDNYHRRKALKKGSSTGRPVRLSEIRERDGNRCHLCCKRVPDKAYPHPLSPSLDHVIPLSKGGPHDPDNVRLAHLRCNIEKGADGGNEQLLLIG